VAPIVRSHHEKWDGSGYPDGLSGEQIPIGARILSAVDCLDALASDRQYRRALPLHEAAKVIQAESGKSFDPRVAEILARRYVELEEMARAGRKTEKRLSTDVKIERGSAPAAGFESAKRTNDTSSDLVNFHRSIAGTEAHSRALLDLTQALDSSDDEQAVFRAMRDRLPQVVGYDAMAIYRRTGERLVPLFLDGEDYRQFASLEIPLGMGLCGWVAENSKAIINGNPSVEPGFVCDPARFSTLRSALAVPLKAGGVVTGVLSLYRREGDAFTAEQLNLLLSVGTKLVRVLDREAEVAMERA
jgi:putative methionine-R-sulfoxide reductase with GAF domain